MNAAIIARILWQRMRLQNREKWTRSAIAAHQARALAKLRAFALAHSPFYRSFHRDLADAPLAELPVLTKDLLVSRFDDLVTDRALRLAELQQHVAHLRGDELFRGRYRVTTTSGSSGLKALIPHNPDEWATLIAAYRRSGDWTGMRLPPWRKTRMALVNSRAPYQQSARVGSTVEAPWIETCRLDAAHPLPTILAALNAFQPEVLVAYASMVRMLATAQLQGKLQIAPRAVQATAEVLTAETRARSVEAWGCEPFDVYATTETGGIAAECSAHQGLHLFEDLVISEVVDRAGQPVPPGTTGARLLVTVLFSRTLPLIRYELADCVRLVREPCACGRTFQLLAAVEGRMWDTLELPGPEPGAGSITIHPRVLVQHLDQFHLTAWQVWQEEGGLRVLLVPAPIPVDPRVVAQSVREVLTASGVGALEIQAEEVPTIPPTPAGKRPLIIRQ